MNLRLIRSGNKPKCGPHGMKHRSFVYCMASSDAVKIGRSQDPTHRQRTIWSQYKTETTLKAAILVRETEAPEIEAIAHYLLRDSELGREWFDVSAQAGMEMIFAAAHLHDQGWRRPPEEKPIRFLAALPPDMAARLDE